MADTLHALAHPNKKKDAAEFAYFSSRCDAVLVGLCLWREGLGVLAGKGTGWGRGAHSRV